MIKKTKPILTGIFILFLHLSVWGQTETQAFILACKAGNAERVRSFLESNPDLIKARDNFEATPLHWAVMYGRKEVVEVLLEYDPEINAVEQHGGTTLHWAAHFEDADTMARLIEKGGSVDHKNQLSRTPLLVAARRGNPAVISVLLDAGADIHTVLENGNTALHIAARNGHQDVIDLLLEKGADPGLKNSIEKTYLDVVFTRPSAVDLSPDLLKEYAGRFLSAQKRNFNFIFENERLYYYAFGRDELLPISETEFITDSEVLYFTFVRNENGAVDEVIYKGEGREARAKRFR